jgi:hypothetical protein
MTTTTTYQLGARYGFKKFSDAILILNTKSIEGVKAWARDEKRGEYVQVLETGPTEWVDDEPQAWSTGNFETVEAARKWASTAYRYLNKGRH